MPRRHAQLPPALLALLLCALFPLVLVACRGAGDGGATPPKGTDTPPKGADTTASVEDTCTPKKLGLGDAKMLDGWTIPPGCNAVGPSGPSVMVTLRSEADFKKAFHCAPEVPSGVDFAVHDLVVLPRMLSPGGAGDSAADDGTKITVVSRFRPPCPNDPMPMPMPYAVAFLLPAHSTRTLSEISCTLEKSCK